MRSTELKRVQREGEQLQWFFFAEFFTNKCVAFITRRKPRYNHSRIISRYW